MRTLSNSRTHRPNGAMGNCFPSGGTLSPNSLLPLALLSPGRVFFNSLFSARCGLETH